MSEPIAEPAAEPVAEVVEAAPVEAPEWLSSPQFQDAVRETAVREAEAISDARMNDLLEQLAALGNENGTETVTPGVPQFDPLGDTFGNDLAQFFQTNNQQLLAQIDERLQAIQAPLAARQEAETVAEGEQRIQDMLADDISRHGDFATDPDTGQSPGKSLVRPLSDMLFPQFAQRYGNGPRAAEAAVSQAAALVRQLEATAAKTARTEHTNRLNTLAGANGEPGTGVSGVVTLPDTPLDNRSLALKYSANAKAITGA